MPTPDPVPASAIPLVLVPPSGPGVPVPRFVTTYVPADRVREARAKLAEGLRGKVNETLRGETLRRAVVEAIEILDGLVDVETLPTMRPEPQA